MAFRSAFRVRILLCLIASPPMRALPLTLLALVLAACDTVDGDSAPITAYEGPEITEADATTDGMLGPRGWSAEIRDAAVVLSQSVLCGDECNQTITLRFEGERNGLPLAIEAEVVQQDYLPERRVEDDVEVARVEIQDWGPEVYSGILYPVPQEGASTAPIVFWGRAGFVVID